MNKVKLSVVILAKNAEKTLEKTLESVQFAQEIIAIDDDSTDTTLAILKKYHVTITSLPQTDFAAKRTKALSLIKTDWILYVDADEVVTPALQQKITTIVETNTPAAYRIKRRNYFLGTEMYPDEVDRLFHRSVIKKWTGMVHESPVLTVEPQVIHEPLLHYTHRDIQSMLLKTNEWSEYEADLRLAAHHPPMAWWRLVRIGMTFFNQNFFGKKLYRYGRAGLFESYFQMIDKLIVYTKLWERQQKAA